MDAAIEKAKQDWEAQAEEAKRQAKLSPEEKAKVGDEVEAVILTLDRDERKMSLGIKQLKQDPWETCLLYTSINCQIWQCQPIELIQ